MKGRKPEPWYRMYQGLSDSQRSNFWVTATNLFLCVFTFWLGLTIQFLVVDKVDKYNATLVRIEYEDKVIPTYLKLLHFSQPIWDLISTDELEKISNKIDSCEKILIKKHREEKLKAIKSTYFSGLNKKYNLEVASAIDSVLDCASQLRFIIPEQEDSIIMMISKMYMTNTVISTYKKNEISDDTTLVFMPLNAFFNTAQWNKLTRRMIGPDNKNDMTVAYNILRNMNINEDMDFLLSEQVGMLLINIWQLSYLFQENLGYNNSAKLNNFWNTTSVWNKSIIVLLLFFIVFVPFIIIFLRQLLTLRSKYTDEEYRKIRDDKFKLQRDVELQRLAIENSLESMNSMKKELISECDKNVELLQELKEKNAEIRKLKMELIQLNTNNY